MPSLTVDDFKIGLDSRKGPSVADADRLLQLNDAYITRGKIPRKRPGTLSDVVLEAGSVGLISANDLLNTFYGKGSLSHADPGYVANLLNATIEHPSYVGTGPDDLSSQSEYTGPADAVFEIVIDAVANFAITIFADSATNPGTHTTVTATGHTFSNTETVEIADTTGDIYIGNHVIQDVAANVFDIPVPFTTDPGDGTAENSTFKWRKDADAFTTGVAVVPTVTTFISEGVQVIFLNAGNGRAVDDTWTINANFYNSISKIHFGDVFGGFMYISAEYDTGLIKHHYLDGSANTLIKDTNCPNSAGCIKMVDKIWAVNGDTVNFSATGLPRDWTTTSDAGFLATGNQQRNADNALALGQFATSSLVVIHEDGAQLWTVDPDPALHVYERSLHDYHSRFPRSVLDFGGDLFALSDGGVRSVSEAVFSNNIQEEDVGSPVDNNIKAVLTDSSDVFAGRFNQLGQYWVAIDGTFFVYTFSRTQKISAWSIFNYPFTVEYMEEFRGNLFLRASNTVYRVDENTFQDDGVAYEAQIQTAFLNAKSPGVNKQWWGMDTITVGTARVTMRYDPNNSLAETSELTLTGDTTPDQHTPVEIISPSLSLIFKNNNNEAFQLDSFTTYFEKLGV